jgi:hypothetical protein
MSRIVVCLIPAVVSLAPTAAEAADRPTWGGGGYASQGWYTGDVSGVGDALGLDPAPGVGLVLGGGGFALLGGRVILGGHGHGLFGLGGVGPAASSAFSGGGGGAHVGYAMISSWDTLLFPHAGVVGHGGSLVVENGTDPAVVGGVDLLAGERLVLEGGGVALDLGADVFRLFWRGEGGGMMVGGTLGVWLPVAGGAWSARGAGGLDGVEGAPGGFYLRMSVGGGGAFGGARGM